MGDQLDESSRVTQLSRGGGAPSDSTTDFPKLSWPVTTRLVDFNISLSLRNTQ